jgi:hypothetical protein
LKILLWSPGIADHQGRLPSNLSDIVIENAVVDQLIEIFGRSAVIDKGSTHLRFGPVERRLVGRADLVIIGESNLLSSYMDDYF